MNGQGDLARFCNQRGTKMMKNETLKIAEDGRIYTKKGTFEKIGIAHVIIALLAFSQVVDIVLFLTS